MIDEDRVKSMEARMKALEDGVVGLNLLAEGVAQATGYVGVKEPAELVAHVEAMVLERDTLKTTLLMLERGGVVITAKQQALANDATWDGVMKLLESRFEVACLQARLDAMEKRAAELHDASAYWQATGTAYMDFVASAEKERDAIKAEAEGLRAERDACRDECKKFFNLHREAVAALKQCRNSATLIQVQGCGEGGEHVGKCDACRALTPEEEAQAETESKARGELHLAKLVSIEERLRAVAERQREACAAQVRRSGWHEVISSVRATPLVTEDE